MQAVAAEDANPADALRGLYISDEQAQALADDLGASDADPLLAAAAERLGLDALDAAVLAVCAAPELHPRYGRLYAYLQDDVTRRLPSPRLVAHMLSGEQVETHDVLDCFAPDARLMRIGALRLLAPDPALPLADRPIKLADRLAAFLLGAGRGLREIGAPVTIRRIARDDPEIAGRQEVIEDVKRSLRADTPLPLVVCGPDAPAITALAAGSPLVLLDVRDLDRPEALADATLACALEDALLCFDGLADLKPTERSRLLEQIEARKERSVLLGRTAAEAQALSEHTVLLVEVPFPSFTERRAAWELLVHAPAADVAAKFRLSVEQIRAAAEVSRVAAQAEASTAPRPRTSTSVRGMPPPRGWGIWRSGLSPGYSWDDLVVPERQRDLLLSISAYLRHRDRVLSEWGYERTVARTQGLKVLFAGESGTGKTMAARFWRPSSAWICSASTSPPWSPSTSGKPRRTWSASSPRPTARTRSCSSTRPMPCSASAPRCQIRTIATPTSRWPTCSSGWRHTPER